MFSAIVTYKTKVLIRHQISPPWASLIAWYNPHSPSPVSCLSCVCEGATAAGRTRSAGMVADAAGRPAGTDGGSICHCCPTGRFLSGWRRRGWHMIPGYCSACPNPFLGQCWRANLPVLLLTETWDVFDRWCTSVTQGKCTFGIDSGDWVGGGCQHDDTRTWNLFGLKSC